MGKRTYYLYDGDQVVCEIAGANSSVAAGGVYGAYAYGPWGMTARWSGTTAEYTSFTWDPFGNPVMRHRQTVVNPADICVYDSRGFIIADKNTSAAGTLPVVDPNGGLGQYGDQTDEELKGTGLASGLQLLTGGGYYDPTAGRYVNRFGGDDDEYRYAWKALGLMGLAGQRAAEQAQKDIAASLDDAQLLISVVGEYPGFGEPFDLANAGISALRGNWGDAGVNLLSAVPAVGNYVGAASITKAAAKRAKRFAQGIIDSGTYKLVVPGTETVVRTGRSWNLSSRRLDHLRDYPELLFRVDKRTMSYPAMRGREQIISDMYRPILDRINAISPKNPRRAWYMREGAKL